MKRVIVFGVALFFAIAGIAPLGEQPQAFAGRGCHGCDGAVRCTGDDGGCAAVACEGNGRQCAGRDRCAGRTRRAGRAHHARRCTGRRTAVCCGQSVAADCCSGVAHDSAADTTAPPAEEPATEAPAATQ